MTFLQVVALVLLIDAAGGDGVLSGTGSPDRGYDDPRIDVRAIDDGRDSYATDQVNERAISTGRDDHGTDAIDERAVHDGRDSYETDAVDERALHDRRDAHDTSWREDGQR